MEVKRIHQFDQSYAGPSPVLFGESHTPLEAVVIDWEKTLITDPEWLRHIREQEILILGQICKWKDPEGEFLAWRAAMARELNINKLSVSRMAANLKISTFEWNQRKQQAFKPERFVFPEKDAIHHLFDRIIHDGVDIGIITNTPYSTVRRILRVMELPESHLSRVQIVTGDVIGAAKPEDGFFDMMYYSFRPHKPQSVLVIGDDIPKDLAVPCTVGSRVGYARAAEEVLAVYLEAVK